MNSRNFIISISDGSGTRKPENPTRGFFTNPNPTRTRKKYDKPDPNPKNCKPDPKTRKNLDMQKICIFIKIYIKFSLKKSRPN